ncbi:MAG TPA: DUF4870 domain-containing protein [Candidatus Altiarchaeales archaeon]|nr:DUF4870 domain-containing protein [Candidatus Altiarchaeales archaeon]
MKITKDEKFMAAISHGSIILTVFTIIGIFIPLLIWLTQREKSKYVEFQAKQAFIYQLIVIAISLLLGLVGGILAIVLVGFLILFGMLIFDIAAVAYGLYAAYKCYTTGTFEYALISDFLKEKENSKAIS